MRHILKLTAQTTPIILRCWYIIRCVILQFGLYALGLRLHGIKVYRLGFSCLDYFFDVLVSWSRDLNLYDWFCLYSILFSFYQFYRFYVNLGDSWCCLICFTSRLLTCSCMHVLMIWFSIHSYDLDLSIYIFLSLHTTWHLPHHSLGSFNSPNLHVKIPKLEAWGFSRLLIRDAQQKRRSSADHPKPYPSKPPTRLSSFSFVTRERFLYSS